MCRETKQALLTVILAEMCEINGQRSKAELLLRHIVGYVTCLHATYY